MGRSAAFYQRTGPSISGGRKQKRDVIMKPVVQLERTGCGIASVAALAGVSYGEASV